MRNFFLFERDPRHHTRPAPGTRVRAAGAAWLLALGLLGGCASAPEGPEAGAPLAGQERRADRAPLAAPGADEAPAEGYLRLAAEAEGDTRARYQLLAAETLLGTGRLEEAGGVLAAAQPLEPPTVAERQLLAARLAFAQGQPAQALAALEPAALDELDPSRRRQALELRISASAGLGQRAVELRSRSALDPLLEVPAERQDNTAAAWAAASALPVAELEALRAEPDPVLAGWADLGVLVAASSHDQSRFEAALEDWRQRFPGHPGGEDVLATLRAFALAPLSPPERVALLLPPGEGRFARAAAAIRDGFMAAWYADPRAQRPSVSFYAATAENARAVFEQAVADGAQMVVGPLEKEAVEAVVKTGETGPGVPTLLLNRLESEAAGTSPAAVMAGRSRFQFALSPEEEAERVAERAWFDGHGRALVLRPEDDWGERVSHAFRARWQELGGELVDERSYLPDTRDFGAFVKQALDVGAGPVGGGGEDAAAPGARWRQDVDVLFMASQAREARQIAPQLRYLGVTQLPVYATSHAYPGAGDSEADSDLEGVTLCDMPWTIGPQVRQAGLFEAIERSQPGEPPAYQRLHAFGIDAYDLLQALGRMRLQGSVLDGQTGTLSVDADGRISRHPLWARYENGRLRLLDAESSDAPLGLR